MPTLPNWANWIAAIQALTVTGVDRHYDYPPESIDIADGVAAFPVLPSGTRGEQLSTCDNFGKSRSVGYVIIFEAAGQGTNEQNYAKTWALLDNLETALDGLQTTTVNLIEYDLSVTGDYPIGNSNYWAIVASVTGRSA